MQTLGRLRTVLNDYSLLLELVVVLEGMIGGAESNYLVSYSLAMVVSSWLYWVTQ